jgi:hypothetical protein
VTKKQQNRNPWQRGDSLTAIGLGCTLFFSAASLVASMQANQKSNETQNKVLASRVEFGSVTSNANRPDWSNPWQPVQLSITPTTVYVGVERRIVFAKPFLNSPRVGVSLTLVNLRPLQDVLADLGYKIETPEDRRRLPEIHVGTSFYDVSEQGFTLRVYVGLPTKAGVFLSRKLMSLTPSLEYVSSMHLNSNLGPSSTQLSLSEIWMANFYERIGTVDVTWYAKEEVP